MFLQPLARQGTAGRDASSSRAGRGGKTRLQFTREKRKEKKKGQKETAHSKIFDDAMHEHEHCLYSVYFKT